jgi:phosphate transport system permease protein
MGEERASRTDFTASEDDNVLVQGVEGDRNALGYFGYAYYHENQGRLRAVAIDNGQGCVLPTPETVASGEYAPLARPVFIYVRRDALQRPEVAEFVRFYNEHAPELAREVGYVAAPARRTSRTSARSGRVAQSAQGRRALTAPPDRMNTSLARRHRNERVIGALLFLCSAVSILTTAGIIGVLLYESSSFFMQVSVVEFLTGRQWTPMFTDQAFGVLPLLTGSLLIAVGAAVVALPVGLAAAIYLSEYATDRVRRVLKPVLEVLAGIPTVVYGFFALTFVTPIIRSIWPETEVYNALSASIVVGIMIIPMVSSLSEDAMSAVPRSLREGAYALGATKFEVATRTVVPAALSGIIASFILAISRAIGETMIVTIAAGGQANLTLNPLRSVQTMTAYIAQTAKGELAHGTVEYQTIFAVGLALFAITLFMNIVSIFVLRRFREVYE